MLTPNSRLSHTNLRRTITIAYRTNRHQRKHSEQLMVGHHPRRTTKDHQASSASQGCLTLHQSPKGPSSSLRLKKMHCSLSLKRPRILLGSRLPISSLGAHRGRCKCDTVRSSKPRWPFGQTKWYVRIMYDELGPWWRGVRSALSCLFVLRWLIVHLV